MPPKTVTKAKSPTIEDFYEHVLFSGPFNDDRVDNPKALDEGSVDVPSINKEPFEDLKHAVNTIQHSGKSAGVVLWGSAGIGKSHLLARFCRWVKSEKNGIYVFFHNLMTLPEEMPQYLLKCTISHLNDDRLERLSGTQLYKLIYKLLHNAWEKHISKKGKKKIESRDELLEAYMLEVDDILDSESQTIDRDTERQIYRVLFELFCSAYYYEKACKEKKEDAEKKNREELARLARRWLSADALDIKEAKKLNIEVGKEDEEEGTQLHGGQQVERILVAMARLAQLNGQPFVLVFDQVDNMNPEQVAALSHFCHTLLDHTPNLLIVTSGVQQTLIGMKKDGIIPASCWERVAKTKVQLASIDQEQAHALVSARVESFMKPFDKLKEVKKWRKENALFPLGTGWLEQRLADTPEFRPRDVINWSRQRWSQNTCAIRENGGATWLKEWKDGSVSNGGWVLTEDERAKRIDEKAGKKVEEQINRRELEPSTLPADVSNMVGLMESLLGQCLNNKAYTLESFERFKEGKGKKPNYHILATEIRKDDGKKVTTGLTFLATGSKTSAAATLRRIVQDDNPPDHVLLVTDKRMPLTLAAKGKKYHKELKGRGNKRFDEREMMFSEYAGLDALQAVIGSARSHDLEIEGDKDNSVSETEVIASHHRCDRYRKQPLLWEFLTEKKSDEPVIIYWPDKKKVAEFIMAQLALHMGMSAFELAHKFFENAKPKKKGVRIEDVRIIFIAVAKDLHEKGKLNASAINEDLYLLPGKAQ